MVPETSICGSRALFQGQRGSSKDRSRGKLQMLKISASGSVWVSTYGNFCAGICRRLCIACISGCGLFLCFHECWMRCQDSIKKRTFRRRPRGKGNESLMDIMTQKTYCQNLRRLFSVFEKPATTFPMTSWEQEDCIESHTHNEEGQLLRSLLMETSADKTAEHHAPAHRW